MTALLTVVGTSVMAQEQERRDYAPRPPLPEYTSENGALESATSSVLCRSVFHGYWDLGVVENFIERTFGDGVVLEEAYPHFRCVGELYAADYEKGYDLIRVMFTGIGAHTGYRPPLSLLKQMMYYFQVNAKHKDFLAKVSTCRVNEPDKKLVRGKEGTSTYRGTWVDGGCMDYFEYLTSMIEHDTEEYNVRLLTAIRAFFTLMPGPVQRDVEFCQEILHEPPKCRERSISSRR